ncbi:capsular biosynthesis protein [Mucilaginibacter sp. PPCGB 2223]|uniref:tyrosine-protein phosphatase n=1 Tax=Mucilaginibacter sp. PPCGB 2223 TaxID=1886027 RepID=UPI000825BF86|nr:CpsB/CapC family capsule biosynthesis tyrosine phosphatase [Mucilaginibacter sp. PPCGB 2223]OCX51292.1 capsular biosynthesis protein [Mucilaginibacter sp. PPCGB 2223]
MFGLFKKRRDEQPKLNFEAIAVDMHSHVLPGIDDGAQNPQESIELIKTMMSAGIKKIIATPHVMNDYYRNTPESIKSALAVLKAELAEQQIDIPVEASAEYFFDEVFMELVEKNELLPMGKNYILFEFSFVSPPPVFIPTIIKLKDMGYIPILAHPERYPYYTLDQYKNLKQWGCMLQLNTISLTGYYGRETKLCAEELVDNQLVDFISSDMHATRHADAFVRSLEMPYVQRLLAGGYLCNKALL